MADADLHGSHQFIDFIHDLSLKLSPNKGFSQGLLVPSLEAAAEPLRTVLKDVDKMLEEVNRDDRLESMEEHKRDETAAILLYLLE